MTTFITAEPTWEQVISGTSPEEFRDGTPTVTSLVDGQEFMVVIDLEWWAPFAPLFDLFLAEQFVSAFLDVGGRIINVWGEGLRRVVIWAKADATLTSGATQIGALAAIPIIPIKAAIALAIIGIGLALAVSLIVMFVKVSQETANVIGMMITMVVIVMMMKMMTGTLSSGDKGTPVERTTSTDVIVV